MQVSQDLAVENEGETLHIEIGPFDRGGIMKHQENTGDGEDDEEKAGNSSEAEGIGESKAMALHLCGKDMKEEVVIDYHGSLQVRIRYPGSENGSPDRRL